MFLPTFCSTMCFLLLDGAKGVKQRKRTQSPLLGLPRLA